MRIGEGEKIEIEKEREKWKVKNLVHNNEHLLNGEKQA